MAQEKEATSTQVLKWALNHASIILTGAALIGSGYLGWNHLQTQWEQHVAPNCKETPTAELCKIEQLDQKMDRMKQKLDQIMLIVARRR